MSTFTIQVFTYSHFAITYYFQKSPVGFSEEWIGNSEKVKIANLLSKTGDFWQGWPKWTSEEFLREKFEAEVQKIQRIYMFLELLKPKTKVGQNDSVFQFRVFCISAYLLVPHELFQPSIRAIAWLLVSAEYCSRSQFLCRRKLLFSRDAQGNPLLENQ